jgi:hypothetical protein
MRSVLASVGVLSAMMLTACDGNNAFLREADGTAPPIDAKGTAIDLYGDVMVFLAPNGTDLIVALDGGNERPDGSANQVFTLQRSNAVPGYSRLPAAGVRLSDARLRVTSNRVQIQHPEFSATLLLAGDAVMPPEGVSTAGGRIEWWEGYGLARASGSWTMTPEVLTDAAARGFVCGGEQANGLRARFAVEDPIDDDEGRCAAGGEGAGGCSLTIGPGECSVSCKDGYYACCNLLGGCRCVAEEAEVQ